MGVNVRDDRSRSARRLTCPVEPGAFVVMAKTRSRQANMMDCQWHAKEQVMDTPREGMRILGSLRSADGVGVVRMEDRIDAGVKDLWSALTERSQLASWYGDVEGNLRLDGEYRAHLHASGWDGTGHIDACEPGRRVLVTTRDSDSPDSEGTIEVTLTADGDRTDVVWEERGMPVHLL